MGPTDRRAEQGAVGLKWGLCPQDSREPRKGFNLSHGVTCSDLCPRKVTAED